MFDNVVAELIASMIAGAAILLFKFRKAFYLSTHFIRPNERMRVSFAALLRISSGGRYLLIRNVHRPETFAPIGGVYKYSDAAKATLDGLEFVPQETTPEMHNDLRGFLPRKRLSTLVRWFRGGENRETARECICREVKEEIGEAGVKFECPVTIDVRLIRSIDEGPGPVPGQPYTQLRLIDVYEIADGDQSARQLAESLIAVAEAHDDLLLVTPDEITSGRADTGQPIGAATCYLIGEKRTLPDAPMFKKKKLEA